MNLFIDANIYLNYFKMSSENTDSLSVLLEILKTKKNLCLLLPEQTMQEYSRNRSNVINETKIALKKQKNFKPVLPPIVRNSLEAKKIKKLLKKVNSYYEKIIKRHDRELKNENSKIDKVISEIFDKATKVLEEKDIIDKAFYRMLKGNPPGKKDSYGDAIIWESILNKFTNENLAIVTNDGDWLEKYDKENLNRFLCKEWQKKTKKRIKVYSSLGKFINDFEKKPTIKKETIEREEKLGIIGNIIQGGILTKNTASGFVTPGTFTSPSTASYGYLPWSSGLKISTKKECPTCKSINVFDTGDKTEELIALQTVTSLHRPIYECKNCGERFVFYE